MEIFKAAITAVQRLIILFGTGLREVFNAIGTASALLVSKFRTLAEFPSPHCISTGAASSAHGRTAPIARWTSCRRASTRPSDRRGRASEAGAVEHRRLGHRRRDGGGAPKGGTRRRWTSARQGGEDPRLAAMLALQKAQQEAALRLQLEYLKEAADIYDDAFTAQPHLGAGLLRRAPGDREEGQRAGARAKRQELADAQAAEEKAQAKAAASVKSQDRAKAETEVIKFKTEQVKLQGRSTCWRRKASTSRGATRTSARTPSARSPSSWRTSHHPGQAAAPTTRSRRSARDRADAGAAPDQRADQAFNLAQKLPRTRASPRWLRPAGKARADPGRQRAGQADRQAIDVQIEAEELQHQQRMTDDRPAGGARAQAARAQAQQSIQDGFASAMNQFLSGQKSLWGALKSFLGSTLDGDQQHDRQTLAKNLLGAGSTGGGGLDSLIKRHHGQLRRVVRRRGIAGPGKFGVVGENGPELVYGGRSGAMVIPSGIFNRAHRQRQRSGGGGGGGMGGGQSRGREQPVHDPGPVDSRTQQQIARAAGRSIQSAACEERLTCQLHRTPRFPEEVSMGPGRADVPDHRSRRPAAAWRPQHQVWTYPLGKWDIGRAFEPIANAQATIAFHRNVAGRAYGFRMKDPLDNYADDTAGVLGTSGLGTGAPTTSCTRTTPSAPTPRTGRFRSRCRWASRHQAQRCAVTAGSAAGNYASTTRRAS
jgi:hypothetical protein